MGKMKNKGNKTLQNAKDMGQKIGEKGSQTLQSAKDMGQKIGEKGNQTLQSAKDMGQKIGEKGVELKKDAYELSNDLKQLLSDEMSKMEKKEKKRSAEIMGIFAKHNFYAGGFTPVELRTTLEDLGPTYVKIGQIMSSRVDLLPESYCNELEKLRQNVKELDPAVARAVIEQETGKKINELFREFRDKPLGSASIGQVHYGELLDGTRVVTKVQRPLIADMMQKDFVLLKKVAGLVNIVADGDDENNMLDLMSVITELEKVTNEELDFRVEAENTRFFKENCIEDETKVTCPTIIDGMTTERIMTMTFVDGYSISDKERIVADGIDPVELGRRICDNYLHQVLDVGTFHADPHQGNIMVASGVATWIDFGMVGHISDANINMIQDLVLALLEGDLETLVSAAMSMGATSAKTNRDKLIEDLDGFMEKYSNTTSIADVDTAAIFEEFSDLASQNHIVMPGEFTMLVRSLATIEGVIEQLCPELNLFELLSTKFLDRAKKNFDIQQELLGIGKDALSMGKKAARIPSLASDALKNIVKGKMKMNLELTGYDELMNRAMDTVKSAVLALFACILFFGSCLLCMTDIKPVTPNGMPLFSVAGFLFSIALAIYTVKKMSKKK